MKLTFTLMKWKKPQDEDEEGYWWFIDGEESDESNVVKSIHVLVPKYLRCFVQTLLLVNNNGETSRMLWTLFEQSWIVSHPSSSDATLTKNTRFQWTVDTRFRPLAVTINVRHKAEKAWHSIQLGPQEQKIFEHLITAEYTQDMMIPLTRLLISAGYKHCPCNT